MSGVRDGAVLALDQAGVKRLRGYVVLQSGASLDGVRRELVARLPPYMVPSTLVQIDEMPLTRNGKVDRVRLATVEPSVEEPRTSEPQASLGPVHSVVADVLGRPKVDVDASFFDLGLTSLDLLAVSNRLRAHLGRDVPITLLFQYTSVAALERHMRRTPTPEAATTSGTALPSTSEPDLTDPPILPHFLDDPEGALGHA